MRASLRDNPHQADLSTFSFLTRNGKLLDADFEWEEQGEFRYQGRMYDVIKAEQKGDSLLISAIDDTRETALLQKFQEDVERSMDGRPGSMPAKTNLLLKIWTGQDLPPAPFVIFQPVQARKQLYHSCQYCCTQRVLEVQTPPPRFV